MYCLVSENVQSQKCIEQDENVNDDIVYIGGRSWSFISTSGISGKGDGESNLICGARLMMRRSWDEGKHRHGALLDGPMRLDDDKAMYKGIEKSVYLQLLLLDRQHTSAVGFHHYHQLWLLPQSRISPQQYSQTDPLGKWLSVYGLSKEIVLWHSPEL